MGFLAIMLRYGERGYFQPLVEGIKNCFSRVFWLATCGRCGPCAALLSCCRCCRGSEKSPRSETKADLEETLETDAAQVEAEVHSSSSSGHTTDLPDPEPSAPSPAPARLARRCECWRWPLAVLRRVVLKAPPLEVRKQLEGLDERKEIKREHLDKWNELGGTQRAVQPMPQGIAPGTEGW
ncbi:unnamed protein product [Cladocopium goreaui]|uniref:Uncharacterized protein n=1 Tax=Cladocopium goreaui TaxID=2562237 RepID=A0A9P1GGZ9_9DINO|nr:unnamed protein product [Cladocopium goreaui]